MGVAPGASMLEGVVPTWKGRDAPALGHPREGVVQGQDAPEWTIAWGRGKQGSIFWRQILRCGRPGVSGGAELSPVMWKRAGPSPEPVSEGVCLCILSHLYQWFFWAVGSYRGNIG